jgi:hypothetical protein
MSAARIAHVLGGAPTGGGGFICRCPVPTHGSGRGDRRPSLSVRDGHSRPLVKCFSGCDVREVLAELRRMDLLQARDENDDPLTNSERSYSAKRINKNRAPASSASSSKTTQHRAEVTKNDYKRRQHEKAEWLWSQRRPIIGTVAERYLCARGYYGPIPQTIAFLPARDPYPPALIAAFGMPEEPEPTVLAALRDVSAVHITRLKPDGSDRERGSDAKIMIGGLVGSPIVLAPVNDLLGLAITEGIEDALSVHVATELGVWAAASASRMPALADTVPSYVETVTIFAHPDKVGQDKARELASKLHGRGLEVFVEGIEP